MLVKNHFLNQFGPAEVGMALSHQGGLHCSESRGSVALIIADIRTEGLYGCCAQSLKGQHPEQTKLAYIKHSYG